jgi:hypothetical protein
MHRRLQNRHNKGLTAKILQNKELGVTPGSAILYFQGLAEWSCAKIVITKGLTVSCSF